MARSLRIEYPGAFYHVMARGNRREPIYLDADDRHFFLNTLAQACKRTGWKVHAWVLMTNHYHLFIETPEPNLVDGMKWLQNTYTRRFNIRHHAWGRLFGDRYKAIPVQGDHPEYYQTLLDYIHLNPVRARIIRPAKKQSLLDFPWSSLAGAYALPPSKRASWVDVPAGLASFDLKDTTAGRRRYVEHVDRRAVEEETTQCGIPPLPAEIDARCSHLRRGWYWGTQKFSEDILGRVTKKLRRPPKARAYRSALELKAHGLEHAEQRLKEGLAVAGLTPANLKKLPGNDPHKIALAKLIWEHTTVTQDWIAEKLFMKSAANVSQILRRSNPKRLEQALSKEMHRFLQ